MIRVEVIPPEFDLSRPVKGEKALLVESIGDIFTGKNQRSKSRHTRSIVGQRGSGDADGKTKLIFELANGGNKISGFFTAFGFLSIASFGKMRLQEHRRVHLRGNLYYSSLGGTARAAHAALLTFEHRFARGSAKSVAR